MHDPAFAAPGRFRKGNLHTHSDRSDGHLPPSEVCDRYRAAGYDFIALTDHLIGHYGYPIVDTKPHRRDGFTTLIGAELHSGAMENGELWHLLAVGLPEDFAPPDCPAFDARRGQEAGAALAARARAAGAFVAVVHPEWSGLSLADAASIGAAHAVEVYNHGSAVGADRPHGFWHADRLAEAGRDLTLIATDDAHFGPGRPDHFGGWVMVRAQENTPEALLDALKRGRHYSSTGPEISEVSWHESHVELAHSDAVTVTLIGAGSASTALHGEGMTRTTLPFGRCAHSPWLRLTVTDAAGGRAWTNPLRR